jgi:hypothetical protein
MTLRPIWFDARPAENPYAYGIAILRLNLGCRSVQLDHGHRENQPF